MLDYYLTVYFKLPLHILPSVKAKLFTICYGFNVWHFCSFFTSYEQKGNLALAHSVPRYFNFLSSFLNTSAKATCIWGRVRKGLGQKNPFIESNLFHLWINKYCEWGIAILSSLNTTHGKKTRKNQREKTHLNLMSRGKDYHGELLSIIC